MIYLRPNKRWKKKTLAKIALVLLVLAVLLFFNTFPPEFLRQPLITLATPFWQTRDWSVNIFETLAAPFANKKILLEENSKLKNELERKNLALAALADLAIENQELKELGGRALQESFVLAAILNRPPISPYDTLVIDAGSDNGIAEGDLAAVTENIVIGKIVSVKNKSSVVSLFSTPEKETPVAVGLERAEAPARGQGGGNFEIRLPNGAVIIEGDSVVLPGINHRLLGFVSEIQTGLNDPFQTILFRLPVNLNSLRFLMILKK